MIPFFIKGLRREVNEDNMYATPKLHQSGELGTKLEKEWFIEVASKKDPSLLLAILKVFKCELIWYGVLNMAFELVR